MAECRVRFMATQPQPHTAARPTESPSICFQILSLREPSRCHLDLDTRCGDLMANTQVMHLQSTVFWGFFSAVCLRRMFFILFLRPFISSRIRRFYTLLPKSHSGHDSFAVSLWDCLCPVKLVFPPFPPESAALKPFWLRLLGVVWGIGTVCLQVCVSVLR